MQQKEAQVIIYNENQEIIGSKPRKQINKKSDILKTVNIILTKNQKVFMIKASDSVWPNKWGGSCAGLVRENETTEQAAQRTLKRELNIETNLKNLEESFQNFNGTKRIFSIFHSEINQEINPNPQDVQEGKWISFQEAEKLIQEEKCMPTFKLAFSKIKNNLLF